MERGARAGLELTADPLHSGLQRLITDLNRLYRERPALHRHDFEPAGFEWIDCHDATQSVASYLRKAGERFMAGVLNFTPVPRHGYRIGVPAAGVYLEILNSDSRHYGGSDVGNFGRIVSEPVPWMGKPHSLIVNLPPLGALILDPGESAGRP